MIRKIAALMVVAFATLLVPFTSPAHAAYGPKLPTSLDATFVVAVHGDPLKVRFRVSASDGTSPDGTVSYTISRVATAARGVARTAVARATSDSVAVHGSAVTVSGQDAASGKYLVRAHFTPSDTATYLGSNGSDRAAVRAGGGGHHTNNGGGGLPNTGGPDLGWLIAGVLLAGAGAATVTYARRRTPAAA